MAAGSDWSCPICGETQDGVTYVNPCLHQFCLGCIVRWAKRKASCPLCRQTVQSIIYSVRSEEDFLEMAFWQRASPPSVAGHQDEQRAADPVPVGGFLPRVWAGLFRDCTEILEPLMPWLRQQLLEMYRECWWMVDLVQADIIAHLCHYGPDEEALVWQLQPFLQHWTVTFVHRLVAFVAERCRERFMRLMELLDPQDVEEQEHSPAWRLLLSYAAEEEDDSAAASPSPTTSQGGTPDSSLASSSSPESSNSEEETSTLEAALHGGPGQPPSASVTAEQEQPQEESGEAGRDCSPGEHRCPTKRRAPSPQGSPQPCKRPPRQWH
ncbi:unnamed protein product [Bubo scandiacus]